MVSTNDLNEKIFEKLFKNPLTNYLKCDIISHTIKKREVNTMAVFTKEKNIIKFGENENKLYTYDINTGELIGLKGMCKCPFRHQTHATKM